MRWITCLILTMAPWSNAHAEGVSPTDLEAVVSSLAGQTRDHYVLADSGEDLAAQLASKLDAGGYADLEPDDLASTLTDDLREWSDDLHFFVYYAGQPPDGPPPGFGAPFAKVERHGGIVVLTEILKFSGTKRAAETMKRLGKAEALVFDLRECTGGERITVGLVAGYLFPKPVHLASWVDRDGSKIEEWSARKVPGKRLPDTPVYVVIGERTGSGCEAFAFHLKERERATVVGTTSAGAAHSVGTFDLAAKFRAFIPQSRPVSPVSGDNWQGTGVTPLVEAEPEEAMDKALQLAKAAGRDQG